MLELAAVLQGIRLIRSVLGETKELLAGIRGGLGSNRRLEEAKASLAQKLNALEDKLSQIGSAARAAEAYLLTHDEVRDLLVRCERTEEFVKQHEGSLSTYQSPDFRGNWKLVEMLYQAIEEKRDVPQKVILNRVQWFDQQDHGQITSDLQDFEQAFQRSSGRVEDRKAAPLLNELATMQRHLVRADTALRDTVYSKILAGLKDLSAPGTPTS